MTYEQLAQAAKGSLGPWCKACPICDGRACGSHIPGPGSKGSGNMAARNHEAWKDYRLSMDTIRESFSSVTDVEVLGHRLSVPIMIGPVGDVPLHYSDAYTTEAYNDCILRSAHEFGTLAWTGDGNDPSIMENALGCLSQIGGAGIPTIKPWSMDVVFEKLEAALALRPAAIAMDVDAAGLPFLRGKQPPAGAKSVRELREVAHRCHKAGVPFIVKGIMSVRGAEKAERAHADAIVVSNHGGRVLDGVPATAEILPDIAQEVGGSIEILVDGGLRSGIDVFRALALGARAVLMCRPFVVATFGGGREGICGYLSQLQGELIDAMEMCGARVVRDIGREMLW